MMIKSAVQPTSGADVSLKLVVSHFCVSDLSVELQSQGVTRRPYDTNLVMSVRFLLLCFRIIESFVFLVSIWLLSQVRYSFLFYSAPHQPHAFPPYRHLGPYATLISIYVMLVSPRFPTMEEDDELKIDNIQFNFLCVIANQETFIELVGFVRKVFLVGQTAL